MSDKKSNAEAHYKVSLKIVFSILSIWAFVSYGCSILFRDWMDINMPKVGNAPFGFWMAQQGSIICFVLLLIAYTFFMNKADEKFGFGEEDK
jgi:putative solute:sodium symporter small subunit